MLEDFLRDIYEKSMTLELVKEASFYSDIRHVYKRRDSWNDATAYLEKILFDLRESDMEKAVELLNSAQKVQSSYSNWHAFSSVINSEVVPMISDYLRKYIGIEVDDGKWTLESSQTGFLTIKNNTFGYLHSSSDPMWESFLYAYSLFKPEVDNYYILGDGLGYLAYQLWRMSDGEADIYVFELDKEICEYADKYGVLSYISENKLHIITDDDAEIVLEQYNRATPGTKTVRTIYNMDFSTYKGVYSDRFKVQLSYELTERACEHIWRKNYESNLKLEHGFLSDLNTASFKDEWVVVGAGPSLNDNAEFIKESVGKRTICAINASLKWFSRNIVIPDVCTACDPLDSLIPHIEGIEEFSKSIPLVADCVTNRSYVGMYKGPKYYIYSTSTVYTVGIEKAIGDIWKIGGTVTSMAIDLAYRMGAKKIYLIGADLAYPDGVTYADGVGHDVGKWNADEATVISVEDRIITTSIRFNEYRSLIEEQIADYKDVEVINRSYHGAYIRGTFCNQWWENIPVYSEIDEYIKLFDYLKKDSFLLDWKKKYYIFWQIIGKIECIGVSLSTSDEMAIDETYDVIYESFKNELNWDRTAKGKHANDQTYIFTLEYKGENDLNSERLLTAAKDETENNHKVLIVNTAEKYGGEKIAMHNCIDSEYNKTIEMSDKVFLGNKAFAYFQFPEGMPSVDYYKAFLESILNNIPGKMIVTGNYSLLADYCQEVFDVQIDKLVSAE